MLFAWIEVIGDKTEEDKKTHTKFIGTTNLWIGWNDRFINKKKAKLKEHEQDTNTKSMSFYGRQPHETEEPNINNNENWHTVGWGVTVFSVDLCSKPRYHLIQLTDEMERRKKKRRPETFHFKTFFVPKSSFEILRRHFRVIPARSLSLSVYVFECAFVTVRSHGTDVANEDMTFLFSI